MILCLCYEEVSSVKALDARVSKLKRRPPGAVTVTVHHSSGM
jgi:hypothetical protein